ncbi:MAG: hypothetical protein ACLP8S_29285 [Solirubrobacteraceae bacterium]
MPVVFTLSTRKRACMAALVALGALLTSGCAAATSSSTHTGSPARGRETSPVRHNPPASKDLMSLRSCLQSSVRPDLKAILPRAATRRVRAESGIELWTGGHYQQGDKYVDVVGYDTSIFVFATPRAAARASRAVNRVVVGAGTLADAQYRVGRAYVADTIDFYLPFPPALPAPLRSAVNECLRRNGD